MNRTRISVISTITVVVEAVLLGLLTMVRTRYILQSYGTNINGVMQLANQLTAYMLLFESGMTAAYQYSMYGPLLEENNSKISGLYRGMAYDFKFIAMKMLVCVLGVAFVYSVILQNRGVTYAEAASLLCVMGIRLVAPYIFTVPLRTMLIVKEKKYVTDIVETGKNALALVLEIVLIRYTRMPLFWILFIQVFLCYVSRVVYKILVNRYYGNGITEGEQMDRSPKSMTTDIIVHRISGLINSNTDAVLLSMFKGLGLNSVTVYTSFSTIISYPVLVVSRVVESMRATLALKINADVKSAYSYFREMMSFSKLCVLVVIPVYISQINDFVTLWIGKEYTVSLINAVLFGLTAVHQMMIPTVYATRDSFGLYKESKKFAIAQAVVNMVLSVLLIKPLGISGILIGTVVADWFVIEPLNIQLIFHKVFFRRFDMLVDYVSLFAMIAVIGAVCTAVNTRIFVNLQGWLGFFARSAVVSIVSCVLAGAYLYLSDSGFRKLIGRFLYKPI